MLTGRRKPRKRQGRCFELALLVMLRDPDADELVLVHGCVRMFGLLIAHAWIETEDGKIYDPVDDTIEPAEQYVARTGAIIERRYSQMEAMHPTSKAIHYGPWHESAGISRSAARLVRRRVSLRRA
jgi:hypothetical protein